MELKEQIIALQNKVRLVYDQPDLFDTIALEIFRFQAEYNPVYKQWVELLGVDPEIVTTVRGIPFLPIELFKTHDVTVFSPDQLARSTCFTSSGTTGQQTSKHWVIDTDWYIEIAIKIWSQFFGPLHNWTILALLPSYLDREGSSLIYMLDGFMKSGLQSESGFFLNRTPEFNNMLDQYQRGYQSNKLLVWGVTFSLLDWAQKNSGSYEKVKFLETGGMKGRGREMIREELHATLAKGLGVQSIMGEYGMTELLSQAYSFTEGLYHPGATMKILIRDDRDPFTLVDGQQRGLVSVIDLANITSCSFIATQDIGQMATNGTDFYLLGRADHADVRGCNLLI